jgi:hypothetical protein
MPAKGTLEAVQDWVSAHWAWLFSLLGSALVILSLAFWYLVRHRDMAWWKTKLATVIVAWSAILILLGMVLLSSGTLP